MRTISSYICWLQGKFKVGVVSKKSWRTILVKIYLMPLIWLSGNGPSLLGLVSRVLFLYRKGSFLVAGIETVHEPTVFKQHSFMILPFWRLRFWPWSHRTKNQGDSETCIHFDVSKQDWISLVGQMAKNLPAMRETQARSLGWEHPLEEGMATRSSILAWRIPWTEEPGWLQPKGVTKELDTT